MDKTCGFCDNPLHEIRLGPQHTRLWVHRGTELLTCKNIKLDKDLLRQIMKIMVKLGKHGAIALKRDEEGEVVIFGTQTETGN